MDVREKLVELIAQKVCGTWSESCDEWMPHDCGKCYANDCHISEIADHLISNGVTVQEWISVKDRLPEFCVSVLARCFYNGKWRILVCHTSKEHGGEWYTDEVCQWVKVTHWMPLPELPKGE